MSVWTLTLLLSLGASGLDGLDRVRAVLERGEAGKAPGEAELALRLAALGADATPALFALVRGSGLDELVGDGATADQWWCPLDRVDDVALAALAQAPPRQVVDRLRELTGGEADLDARLAEARVLAALRSSLGLPRLLEILAGLEIELRNPSIRTIVRSALSDLLVADLRSFPLLENALAGLGPQQKLLVCEALVASRRPQAADLLETLLDAGREVRPAALDGLVTLASQVPWRVRLDLSSELRELAGVADARVRAQALRAFGTLADSTALPILIGVLEDADPGVRRAAQDTLLALSGRQDLQTPEDWRAWMQSEATWWRETGQPLLAALAADEVSLPDALRAATPHVVARASLAEVLAARMPSLEPGLQRMACGTLERLGMRSAVPALIEVLYGAEPEAREAAWKALRALTGQTLPPEPKIWEGWAFG